MFVCGILRSFAIKAGKERNDKKEMRKMEKTGIADIAGIIEEKAVLCNADSEAWIIKWTFSPEEARNHISLNLERTKNAIGDNTHEFWLAVEKTFNAITEGKIDEVEEFSQLLKFANKLEPREERILPLLEDNPFLAFRSQLFALLEDYKKK